MRRVILVLFAIAGVILIAGWLLDVYKRQKQIGQNGNNDQTKRRGHDLWHRLSLEDLHTGNVGCQHLTLHPAAVKRRVLGFRV